MPLRSPRPPRVGAAAAGLVLLVAVAVSACTGQAPDSVVTSTSASPTSSGSATPQPVPTFSATASTAEALRVFDHTVKAKVAADPGAQGRDIVDALVKAGFAKKSMEVTADSTSIGREVDSIEFAVRWRSDNCLVGQIGSTGFASTSSPVLKTGKCLIGTTRAIDW